ncbi:serine/threonine-protein kinase PknK [Sandaracinus amylolyticus]|uniref:serine/threonine-protein kinase n=1 Tax=Sandaracinus amylolyticus TaxID=927083 RepID=UPI001F30E7C3|nr:serine/threonine-protein kinase [Sandaracinus amylolyticus]UJR86990.1 Hypothetical protein I5071_90910 [Sandaracinus amylolyticus]
MHTIPLGPFELHGRVAQGGMGEIWRGVHRAQGVPVAVKVMTGEAMQDARYYDEFRREVQAAARLSHPRIAMVFEYGAIPAEAGRASGGALVAGSPYLVMEWASRGSLDDLKRPLSWRELRGLLLALLDALSHAHALGIVHRDLKPGNVLLADEGPFDRAVRLSDFGIARAQPREEESCASSEGEMSGLTETPSGTPFYMAPEQVFGRFRDYGAWTDLYALGILTWELVCGELPFTGSNVLAIFYQHLEQPLPPLRPRIAVPAGLEAWLAKLCAKRTRDRFRCAADAAWALSSLRFDETTSDPPPSVAPRSIEPAAFWDTLPSMPGVPQSASIRIEPASSEKPLLELAVEGDDETIPPQPGHWGRGADAQPTSMRLVGAGLGLWSLRTVPMVDRTSERDALWEALRNVRLERAPRAVVLRGSAGCGKSRLAQWLVERAHEVGAAETLVTSHQAVPDRRQGLARLIERHFRCGSLDAERALARIEEQLREDGVDDAYEWRALGGILLGEGGENARFSIAPTTPGERHVLLTRLFARMTRERPLIVWLDDAQWGEASLALARHVLESAPDLPVLFVLTVRDEELDARPRERASLAAIEAMPRTRTSWIGPLPRSDVRMLAEDALGLSSELARQLEARVAGHPLFALQIVGDWIDRGLLAVGERGFVLRQGARMAVPDDMHALWIGRIDQVLSSRSPHARALVELAAVLGNDVDADEFARACAVLGLEFPADLLEPLILHRMIVPGESGWSFAHGLLRESLVRAARETDRLVTLHRACAAMLEQTPDAPGAAERLAFHRLGAGDLETALDPLLRAVRARLATSDLDAAFGLLDDYERTLATLSIPTTDTRALRGAMVRADAHRLHWDFESCERVAQQTLDLATRAADVPARAEAIAMLAVCARQKGDLALAMSRNRTALGLFDRLDDSVGRARTLLAMAVVARQQGTVDRAMELYERALALFEVLEDASGRGSCLLGLGNLHRAAQRWSEAKSYYAQSRDVFERLGNQGNLAHSVNGLAEVARYEGDLESAERGYREVLRIQGTIGSKATFIGRMNLGLVLITRRDLEGARRELEGALAQLEKGRQRGYLGYTHALLLPCAAGSRDGALFDRHREAAEPLLAETSMIDPDIASAAELAGRLWLDAHDLTRARQSFALAHAQWAALGDDARAAAAQRAVE